MTVLQDRVAELIARHGSVRAAARVLEVDHAYLYRLSTGEKDDPGETLLRRLKLRRVVSYERTDVAAMKEHPSSVSPLGPGEDVQQALETLSTALRMQRNNIGTTEEEDTQFHLALQVLRSAKGLGGCVAGYCNPPASTESPTRGGRQG